MSTDITALTTNVGNLDEYTDKNEKQEQDRKEKDEQLNDAIEKKVKKEEHKRERPKSRDGTIKECKKLFKEGASPAVLTKLEKSLIGQKKYHEYYVQCFLPVLDKKVKQSEEISSEIKDQVGQVISEITYDSKYYFNSIVRSQVEDNTRVETSNGITNTGVQLLKAIEKRNNSKFKKFLKESLKKCTDISNINNEEGKNILHLITSLEGKLKSKFLGTLTKTVTKENLTQLIDGENQGKTPLQEALINKVTKGKHESHTIGSNDNILKFVVALLKHGAKPDQLELSQKILQSLDEKQKSYYLKFLEKLEEPVRQSTLEQKVDIKNKIKEVAAHAINTTDSNGNYLLHSAIDNDDKKLKRFKHLLEKGADIRLKDVNGNNALHLIVTKLKRGQKLEFLKILPEACQEEHFTKVINDKNNNNQTPLHQLLQHMQEKSKKSSPINTDKYKALELFLQNDADITTQDKKGNNALHYITSFEGNQKVTCLELILKLSQNNASLKAQLREAIKATNREGKTPLQKLLFSKVTKEEHSSKSVPRKFVKFLKKPFTEYDDNAMEAIIRLFELGANVDDLQLSKEELQELDKGHWKYYLEFLEKLAESVKETEKAQIE
ncbi:MAG: ankyrin repeat domain-containing protein, partial [Rickettsiales bacterium]|nr:ankyrin repeat domain-containing protein [Rickettsiales bacterium]